MPGRTRIEHRNTQRRPCRPRRAMSLLELMLVLALLVAIGALALPAFRIPFENQRLLKAGELIRVEFNKARIKAMKTGQTQMFRYEAEANTYIIEPYFSEQDVLESDAAHEAALTNGIPGMTGMPQTMTDDTLSQPRELPERIVFAMADVQADMRSLQIQQDIQGSPMTDPQQTLPILFYPDGTTSDARLVLTNEQQKLFVVVKLRSLTGIARVSQLVSYEQLQQSL